VFLRRRRHRVHPTHKLKDLQSTDYAGSTVICAARRRLTFERASIEIRLLD
jgi:hypothetical protein